MDNQISCPTTNGTKSAQSYAKRANSFAGATK